MLVVYRIPLALFSLCAKLDCIANGLVRPATAVSPDPH